MIAMSPTISWTCPCPPSFAPALLHPLALLFYPLPLASLFYCRPMTATSFLPALAPMPLPLPPPPLLLLPYCNQINDRYEFPEELDLDFKDRCIFASEADKNVRNQYRLHRCVNCVGARCMGETFGEPRGGRVGDIRGGKLVHM